MDPAFNDFFVFQSALEELKCPLLVYFISLCGLGYAWFREHVINVQNKEE